MANVNCQACEDLREVAPSLACGGFTDDMCTSLQNDTGLTASSGNNDCTDLDNMNDCLIGNEDANVELFEVCDWKKFMHEFIPNLWTMLKAIICAICGIWTNIHNLWTKVNKHDCEIASLYNGISFDIGEAPSNGSYVAAGKGVSFYQVSQGEHRSDVRLMYIAGGLANCYGSCVFHNDNFTDAKACVNFDNGSVERTSTARLGNSVWGDTGRIAEDGELIYEIRILKSQYPQIKSLFRGNGIETSGGSFKVQYWVFNEGSFAYGQHGGCIQAGYPNEGQPRSQGYDAGHRVPSGWIYVQCRMSWVDLMGINQENGSQYTPYGWMGIRTNRDKVC